MTGRHVETVEVFCDTRLAGSMGIESDPISPLEHVTFTYHPDWIEDGFPLSPDLPLRRGPQRPSLGRELFTAFDDAAPDSWGRKMLFERLRLEAVESGARVDRLTAARGLLMVNDKTRQGALRFRQHGRFLSDWADDATVRDLTELAGSAQRFAETGHVGHRDRLLIGAGSSPGGAQPKAWVQDASGSMLLAKFPKTSDPGDVHLWEMVAIRLQSRAGITVQPSRLLPVEEARNIFLTERFDREGDRRIPYMSMRSALQLTEGEHPSYERLARELQLISAAPREDARELFARAAFGAMVNNIDDHMRNHGLLRRGRGWRLAPSFDVNPSTSGYSDTPLTDRGDLADRDIRDLLEAADSFRLRPQAAVSILRRVAQAISHWPDEARRLGADQETINAQQRAFTGPNADRVHHLA